MITRALVMSGGGSLGAFQIGALKKLMLEDGKDYSIMTGVSVGSLNTACLAQAPLGSAAQSFNFLQDLWKNITQDKVYKKWFLWPLATLWKSSVYNGKPLYDMIMQNLNVQAVRDSGRTVRVGAVNWRTGEYVSASSAAPDFAKWVYASAAYPAIFDPITIGGETYSDGGLRNIAPISEALELGAKEIDVIITSNPDYPQSWDTNKKRSYDYLFRVLGIAFDEIMRTDLQCVGYGNKFVDPKPEYADVKIRLFQPTTDMSKYDSLTFKQSDVLELIDIGYQEAVRVVGTGEYLNRNISLKKAPKIL